MWLARPCTTLRLDEVALGNLVKLHTRRCPVRYTCLLLQGQRFIAPMGIKLSGRTETVLAD